MSNQVSMPEIGCYGLAGHTDQPRDVVAEARLAEELGIGAMFLSERFNVKDAGVLAGAVAATTGRLGIGTAASIHLAAAVPTLVDPCDASGTLYQVHDVISETFDYTGGVVGVPTTPGLGVTLDRDRLREFTVRETG